MYLPDSEVGAGFRYTDIPHAPSTAGIILPRTPRRFLHQWMDVQGLFGLIRFRSSVTVSTLCGGRVSICLGMSSAHLGMICLVYHTVSPWHSLFR